MIEKPNEYFLSDQISTNSQKSSLINNFEETTTSYKRILRKIDYRVLVLYSVSYILVQINKGNISNVAILNAEQGNDIKTELGNLSSSQWAWCLSAFYYPYLIFEAPFTLLAKKFSPKVWQTRIMISWGIVSMLQATSFNFSGIIASRFFLGFFEASWYTTVLYHMSFFYKPRELPKRIALFYSFGMLSSAFSGLLAYGISFMNGARGLSGWRWVFIFEGIPTILLGFIQIFLLPNYVQESSFLTSEEKEVALSNLPKTSPKKDDKYFDWDTIKVLLRDPTFYTYIGVWLFQGIGGWGISFVLPTIVYELGFTDTANTQLMQLPPTIFGFILLNVLGNLIHKRFLKSFPVAFTLSLIQLICYIVLATINNSVGKYVMLIIA
ncbi:uncharacterized protein PRCAT00001488001 [Priceomyces carsonii]|uniref:uncharacterized protein n=1 Tax=Priceomyces carsonii TaxID=28549 RepID=UPI002ED955D8|nr:unnamed protein product [Priceomyces carsonii]